MRYAPVEMLGQRVDCVTQRQAVRQILGWLGSGGSHYVCFRNVHTLTLGRRDARFRSIGDGADLSLADGMGLVWGSALLRKPLPERVDGPGLMLALCRATCATGHSHFFYGGRPGVAEAAARRLSGLCPGLKVAGCHGPPCRPLTPAEDARAVGLINESGADVLWVALGAPKQEFWMAEHVGRLQAPVMLGVGAAFDFYAGTLKRAPRPLQAAGLEWAFRLAMEPRRLWRRYLLGNLQFAALLARALLAGR